MSCKKKKMFTRTIAVKIYEIVLRNKVKFDKTRKLR